jgi:hypothetical protein
MDGQVQCAGECRGWFEAADLDVLGLCEPCGDSYYDERQCDELGFDDKDDFVIDW